MRYVVIGFCVFAAACSGAAPTAPASPATQIRGGTVSSEAKGGAELPFKGTYDGLETVAASSQHHLDATGNATHLGRFTVSAEWMIGSNGGIGTSTWTAPNGDELHTSFTRSGVPAPPTITFTEIHHITGGTGRFADASGDFTVVQTRGLVMPYNNSATFDGTISPAH
jgi:hypothetical protein